MKNENGSRLLDSKKVRIYEKKKIILTSIILGVLVLTLGIGYAIFNYQQTSNNTSQLIMGDIYMHYNETNQIIFDDAAMPTNTYDPTNYFEFTISGKNTYTKQYIWYDIVLNYGYSHETRTTRIEDEFLKFRLVEVNSDLTETELLTNKSYTSLENKRIYINTISKDTKDEITRTYRLYMWISDEVVIGNANQDYTSEEWDNVFASIKVNVTGDFKEKEIAYEDKYNVTYASCFTTETFYIDRVEEVALIRYDNSCGSDVVIAKISMEKLLQCLVIIHIVVITWSNYLLPTQIII